MKLALAVKAALPLIACTTRDTVYFPDILAHVTGRKPIGWKPLTTDPVKTKSLYFWICPLGYDKRLPLEALYGQFQSAGSVLIVVNPAPMEPTYFDAGEVEVPKDMLFAQVLDIAEDDSIATAVTRSLGGVTIKESQEIMALTGANTGELTPNAVMGTRKTFFTPSRGFTQIDTAQDFYSPTDELATWIEDEGGYFLTGNDKRLRARGLLFDGYPGTGKTSGAKFIASKLGVPLFRLDLGGVKGKYVGESEKGLLAALERLDGESPCCVLMDEIEKLFGSTQGGTTGDAGVTSSLLSQILWWLQEHSSRVLTIMTTNKLATLPPELHRPGRIDKRITTAGLMAPEAFDFVKRLLVTFPELKTVASKSDIKNIVDHAFQAGTIPETSPREVPHAVVTEEVHKFVKHKLTFGNGLSKMFNLKE
jgi:hypothetical protein